MERNNNEFFSQGLNYFKKFEGVNGDKIFLVGLSRQTK
jgi:hypothetical protein